MPVLQNLRTDVNKLKSPVKSKILQRFFKTGKGEYGAGDIFLGLTVPESRLIAKKYASVIKNSELEKLLSSKYHEERLIALLILVQKFNLISAERFQLSSPRRRGSRKISQVKSILDSHFRGNDKNAAVNQKKVVDFYLAHLSAVNNWDLVDLSADKIFGRYLLGKSTKILYKFIKSKNLWERRIAIVSTFAFIKQNKFTDALRLSKILLKDKHDLIHKACGWMLREVGKRNVGILLKFLNKNSSQMPRTMLRYAIERLPKNKKKFYLEK